MIGGIIFVLLIWGPQKIPELAKAVGEAKHELETASKGNSNDRDGPEIPKRQRLTDTEKILEK